MDSQQPASVQLGVLAPEEFAMLSPEDAQRTERIVADLLARYGAAYFAAHRDTAHDDLLFILPSFRMT